MIRKIDVNLSESILFGLGTITLENVIKNVFRIRRPQPNIDIITGLLLIRIRLRDMVEMNGEIV